MNLTEKVFCVMPLESGVSQRTGDTWYSQDLILITDERYPKKIALTFKGANVKKLEGLNEGDKVKVTYEIDSRESNGRYFVSLPAWELTIEEKNANGKLALIKKEDQPAPEQATA